MPRAQSLSVRCLNRGSSGIHRDIPDRQCFMGLKTNSSKRRKTALFARKPNFVALFPTTNLYEAPLSSDGQCSREAL